MSLLVRKEIIELWARNNKYNSYYCCPECRDILTNYSSTLMCANESCLNNNQYNLKGETIHYAN